MRKIPDVATTVNLIVIYKASCEIVYMSVPIGDLCRLKEYIENSNLTHTRILSYHYEFNV
jgi:hypothetical protein